MGLLNSLFGTGDPLITDRDRLRDELFAAAGARADSPHRTCAACDHEALDTAVLSDAEVLAAVRDNPSTCLCVTASQQNLTILPSKRDQPDALPERPT